MLPIVFTALSIDNKYDKNNESECDWIMTSFLAVIINPNYVKDLREICKLKSSEERLMALSLAPVPDLLQGHIQAILFLIALIQLILFIYLQTYPGWKLI
jgi:hypothetical protein